MSEWLWWQWTMAGLVAGLCVALAWWIVRGLR